MNKYDMYASPYSQNTCALVAIVTKYTLNCIVSVNSVIANVYCLPVYSDFYINLLFIILFF